MSTHDAEEAKHKSTRGEDVFSIAPVSVRYLSRGSTGDGDHGVSCRTGGGCSAQNMGGAETLSCGDTGPGCSAHYASGCDIGGSCNESGPPAPGCSSEMP